MIEKLNTPHTKTDTKSVCFVVVEYVDKKGWEYEKALVSQNINYGFDIGFYYRN